MTKDEALKIVLSCAEEYKRNLALIIHDCAPKRAESRIVTVF